MKNSVTAPPHLRPQIKLSESQVLTEFGSAAEPDAALTQKDRALLRLAMAMGARLEIDVRNLTRRAVEAGRTPAQLHYAAEVASKTSPSPEMLSVSMWVREVLSQL